MGDTAIEDSLSLEEEYPLERILSLWDRGDSDFDRGGVGGNG